MKHNSYRRYILQLLLAVLVLASCDSINCPLNSTVAAKYSFFDSNGKEFAIGDTLTVTAVGTDEMLVNRLVGQKGMTLPVSYYAPCDTLIFMLSDTLGLSATDTIWIEKESTPHTDDPSCPIHIWHHVTSVRSTDNLIDTIIVVNPDINYDGGENFEIHFVTE